MIVPRSRLLLWTAIILLPFAIVLAVSPSAANSAALVLALFGATTLADVAISALQTQGIGLKLPDLVRLAKDREGRLEVRICNERKRPRTVRLALVWPPEFHVPNATLDAVLPGTNEWSHLFWPCTPRQRGKYALESAFVETASPLGFWAVRRFLPVRSEIRVYPNLLQDRRRLSALFLNRGAFGIHAHRQVGKGREFEKLRDYVPGDDFGEIHWKATARRGRPITKVFQIERTQELYVLIDASRLSARWTGPDQDGRGTVVFERLVTAALVLGLAAEQQGDLFGLLTFSDRIERFVRAKSGKNHYSACRDALYTLQPKIVTPDFEEVCSFVRLRLRRRALLVILTALDDPVLAEAFVRNVEVIRRQHLVVVNLLQTAQTQALFSDPDVSNVNEVYERLGGHLQWHRLRELQKALQRRGVRMSMHPDERMSTELVSQYLGVKRRQLL